MKSMNKKREFYANWFSEIDKQGLLEGRMHIIVSKINRLCPNRDFGTYLNSLRAKMKQMKEAGRYRQTKSLKSIMEADGGRAESDAPLQTDIPEDSEVASDATGAPTTLATEVALPALEERVKTMSEDIARIVYEAEQRKLHQREACARLSSNFNTSAVTAAEGIEVGGSSLPGGRFFRGPGFVAARRSVSGAVDPEAEVAVSAVWRPAGVRRELAPIEPSNSKPADRGYTNLIFDQYFSPDAGYSEPSEQIQNVHYYRGSDSEKRLSKITPELRRSDSKRSAVSSNSACRSSISKAAALDEEIANNRDEVLAALQEFESVVKPMSENQYRRSIELEKCGEPRRIRRQKKKDKQRMLDRLTARGIPPRLKPIDMKDLQSVHQAPSTTSPIIEEEAQYGEAEAGWIRKAAVALSATSDLHLKSSRLPDRIAGTSSVRPQSTQLRVTRVLDAAEVEAEEQRILAKASFGPCSVQDLKGICAAFVHAWARSQDSKGDKQARSGAQRTLESLGLLSSVEREREKNKKSLIALKFSMDQTILVGDFLTSQFITRRRDLREQLSKSIGLAVKRGMYRDRVDLAGLLLLIFPLMKAADRAEACKYMLLSEREEEVKLRDSQPLTEQEEKKLRDMFDYFDSDRSGFVDPKEIFEKMNRVVVDTLSILGGEGITSAAVQRTADRQMDRQGISKLISMVDSDGNEGLDFEEFCKLFRGEFLL
jgi:hypothetical protein